MKIFEKQFSQLENLVSSHAAFYNFLKRCKVKYHRGKYKLLKNLFIRKEKDIIYSRSFFDENLELNMPMAAQLVDIIMKFFHPKSVVDVGCGNAEFLCEFQKRGIEINGYDGSRHIFHNIQVDKKFIELFDLRNVIVSSKRYDLALCLEVAEHIEQRYSNILINSLTNLSDSVIFTAAHPGQGGHFHINEQPREFWIEIFNKYSFILDAAMSKMISRKMEEKGILQWYYENLMIFKRRDID